MCKTTECYDCCGDGMILGCFPCGRERPSSAAVTIHCDRCDGTGQMPSEMARWIARGTSLHSHRADKLKLGLREAATKWGMKPSELSKLERGMVDNADWWPPNEPADMR